MAGRFRIYTDADIRGPLVEALRRNGWDTVRAIDRFPERTPDHVHFEHAIQDGRVIIANDTDLKVLAERAAAAGRVFPGLVWWARKKHDTSRYGVFVAFLEGLAAEDDPFRSYPVRILNIP